MIWLFGLTIHLGVKASHSVIGYMAYLMQIHLRVVQAGRVAKELKGQKQ